MADLIKDTEGPGDHKYARFTVTGADSRGKFSDPEFWQGLIMIALAVGLGLLAVHVDDKGFSDFASTGSWLLGVIGLLRML
ncbi:hypothetical protein [Streptomyces sp. 5-10]|uniref:hypothetical protein n=1 Tax=Streptomyces sp. 5-10 TaxID=878925 RepID=UPI00168BAD90|nr:hypothetical protein [Streptomyces sp. 5-10]MBD3004775.1 hypothetical protein [Streptomyces sp. 5-10]